MSFTLLNLESQWPSVKEYVEGQDITKIWNSVSLYTSLDDLLVTHSSYASCRLWTLTNLRNKEWCPKVGFYVLLVFQQVILGLLFWSYL